jgi:hypothetical protein
MGPVRGLGHKSRGGIGIGSYVTPADRGRWAAIAWIGGGSPVTHWWRRNAQLFRLDRNPLRRGVDRAEAIATTALIAICVSTCVVLVVIAGRAADRAGLHQERAERSWHPVIATLLQSAAQSAGSSAQWDMGWVRARWPLPDGRERFGQVATELNARAGDKVQIWINGAGRQTGLPLTSAGVDDQVAFTVFSVIVGMALVLAVATGGVRLLFHRRRMAGWQRAWDAVGPIWSRRV